MAVKYRQNHTQTVTSYTAWLLYIYAMPFLFSVISKLLNGEVIGLVLVSAVLVALLLSAIWMTTGLKNKAYQSSRKYSKNTSFPMMFLASLVVGVASLVASWLLLQYNMFQGIGFGIAAMVGCWLWYGLDDVKTKHLTFSDVNDAQKALEILQDSETSVLSIEKSSQSIDNKEMSERLDRITSKAREVLDVLYKTPKKIRKARRFLNTYLTGAQSVVKRYAEQHKETDNKELEENFREVLVNIEDVFNKQHEKLISSDVFDLDVDIEVLNTLLKKQGMN